MRQYGHLGINSFGVALPWRNGDVNLNGACVSSGNVIACFDAEVDMCTPPEFELRGVVMDAAFMERTLAQLGIELPDGVWHQLRALWTRPEATARLRTLFATVQDVIDARPHLMSDLQARQFLEDTSLAEIIDLLPNLQPCTDERGGAARKRLVDRACALMFSTLERPMSVLDVCEGVRASRRKLNYCFQDVLGSNPIH